MRSPLRWMDDPVDVDDRWTLHAHMFLFGAAASFLGMPPLLLLGLGVAYILIDVVREELA